MPDQNAVLLWVLPKDLETLSSQVPLEQVVEAVGGRLHKAVLPAGYLGGLAKSYVLAKVVTWRSPEGDVTGTAGIVKAGRHSMYPHGLMFTTYDELDVRYHLRTRTVSQRLGVERIEVHEPDRGKNLDQFVFDAIKAYHTLGAKLTPREAQLLFYQPIKTS